jgi:hypothetical protein
MSRHHQGLGPGIRRDDGQNLEKVIRRPGERRDPAVDLVVRGGCLSTIKGWVPASAGMMGKSKA